MKNRYKCEMDRLEPRPEKLEELYELVEGGSEMKRAKRLSGRAAALLACALLAVTAAAAAAVPRVWDALREQLGVFAPYAQTISGAVCRDQGIQIQVLSALSDDLEARIYLSVQDAEGDRLDSCLALTGRLVTGEEKEALSLSAGSAGTGRFKLLSYDPDTKTALLSASVHYGETARPGQAAQLSITGMSTQAGELYGTIPCAPVTGDILDSQPAGEQAEVIFRPSDLEGRAHLDAALPKQTMVLNPDQTPTSIEGTEDMWISSMGFAGDGCFHIRLGLGERVRPEERGFFSHLFLLGAENEKLDTYQQTLVEGGMDVLFPLLHPQDLELIRGCVLRLYGPYARPGISIEGSWSVDFQMEYHPSAVLDWTGNLAGRQVRQVTVSPLSVTMYSSDSGGFHSATLYAVKKDGATVAAEPGTGRYSNVGRGSGAAVWEAFNTWQFVEPVDLEEIIALTLAGETIPAGKYRSS